MSNTSLIYQILNKNTYAIFFLDFLYMFCLKFKLNVPIKPNKQNNFRPLLCQTFQGWFLTNNFHKFQYGQRN